MRKGDLRRTQILDAAEKLFFERGYEQTSIQDILDALSISKGGFYHYFDAKSAVLQEICERRILARFEKLDVELYASRKSPTDKLNLLLGRVSLMQTESVPFAALMLKICYQDRDAAIRDHFRRIIIDHLTPYVNDVICEGLADDSLYTRRPMDIGRLVLMLACDVDEEVCAMLAGQPENPDCVIRIIEMLNTYRECVETLTGAHCGTIVIFDPGEMVNALQAAAAELIRLEAKQTL